MNKSLKSLIEKNRTAFYTFDVGILNDRISYLKSRLGQEISLCYAVKANPFLIREAESSVDGFEICSPGEAKICEGLCIPKNKMVISGVYKTAEYMETFIRDAEFNGVVTVESLNQFRLISELSEKYRRNIRLVLRLTNDSQFGINESDIEEIIREGGHPFLNIEGIQFFSGTQKTSLKKLQREIDNLDAFLIHLRDDCGFSARTLEYGPGLPVPCFEEDFFDEEVFLTEFSGMLSGMKFKTHIILELGRSIAASCGKYYTHIVDIKQNHGINYAIVDGGMHQIVYFGNLMAMKHPKVSIQGKEWKNTDKSWMICGALCSMNDILVKQIPLPKIEIGDMLCFENAGAYCMTEGSSLFLSRELPDVYLINENGELSRVRESFETSILNTPKYEEKENGKTY